MKKVLPILLGAVGMASMATPLMAAPLSGNAAVTTNYIFRGLSQSGGNPAVQAGLDYDLGAFLPGLAVGTWASSIDFGNTAGGDPLAPMEWDIYGSYTGSITDAFSWSVGTIGYLYPSTASGNDFNWVELWGGLAYNFGMFSVTGKLYYSPDYVALGTHELYYTAGVSVPLGDILSFNASVGHTDLENSVFPVIKDYTDWNLNVAATMDNFTLTVGYTGTDGLNGAYRIRSGPFQTTDQYYVSVGFKLP
jgi:uncharacterized protein (TIGR02001 family)